MTSKLSFCRKHLFLNVSELSQMFPCFPDTSALSQGAKLSWVEFFAGRAEATRVMRLSGRTAAKVDLLYHTACHGKMNYMDINSPAGMALL